ncbi:MAG: hypothetical protein PHS02_04050 [Candidatus ainarchaeum sp.]|nr:hypothetical protein [Candidatus ainarchaeum sp.]
MVRKPGRRKKKPSARSATVGDSLEPVRIGKEKAEELFRRQGIGIENGEKIEIHPLEAVYLMERGKLALENETMDSLMEKVRKEDPLAGEKYAVFRHMRKNGYIARLSFSSEPWIRIYRKGFRPGEDRTQWLLRIVGSGWHPALEELISDMKKAADARKELVYAVVEAGKPLFFKLGRTSFD